MSLTKEQWYQKLRSFLPKWYFEDEDNQVAHLKAIAKLLEDLQQFSDDRFIATFLSSAIGDDLLAHGEERSLPKFPGETDPQYSLRIRNIRNRSNKPALKALIDALLIVGECIILEDYEAARFCNREAFCNRNDYVIEVIENAFSVIVEMQLHNPYSFCSRENFASRENYVGAAESLLRIFELIIETVNRAKALGCLYRVIERAG